MAFKQTVQRMAQGKGHLFSGGSNYAQFRPVYPSGLYEKVYEFMGDIPLEQAVDVGCGTGQVAKILAERFSRVIGTDPSASQLEHASQHERIRYIQGTAENLPVENDSTTLITVAQAMHWINQEVFWKEADRVLVPHGTIAIWGYGCPTVPEFPEATQTLTNYHSFLWERGFWDEGRKLLDAHYSHLNLPYDQKEIHKNLELRKEMCVDEFISYLRTASAWTTMRKREPESEDPLIRLREDLVNICKLDSQGVLNVSWPIFLFLSKKNQ